jgi:hypothetical protein
MPERHGTFNKTRWQTLGHCGQAEHVSQIYMPIQAGKFALVDLQAGDLVLADTHWFQPRQTE